ncbi:MAG: glycosyltransferase family 2 protein [Lachnospiraceae bacterium]|nr:glycosyltransferase family 2 protein [Lachnospiraceae bacterium]
MKFDILFVTFNSARWISSCVESVAASDYDHKDLTLIFHDNRSTDDSVACLQEAKARYGERFGGFIVDAGEKNEGFGAGNNRAASLGNSEYLFIFNVDTKMHPDTLRKLEQEILASDPSVGMWELCQKPFEHPKYWDPLTGYTSWSSGACMIVRRKTFEELGGFDKNIFMYAEDVDLSWNFRKHGWNLKYLWNVEIDHYSYDPEHLFKPVQFLYSYLNNWYLRAKYGSFRNFLGGFMTFQRIPRYGAYLPEDVDEESRQKVIREARKRFLPSCFRFFFTWLKNAGKHGDFHPVFRWIDYEAQGTGPFTVYPGCEDGPLVSVLIRTMNRPEALREALYSIRRQTYKNIEAVVVEDGPADSEEMIRREFPDLNVDYYALGKNEGRCIAGNTALSRAKGKYLNFLDDDDMLYPRHVETLVGFLEREQAYAAYAGAFETRVDVVSKRPYSYKVREVQSVCTQDYTKEEMLDTNFIPIQCLMFRKELFTELGGFDTTVETFEDWDLWTRYSLKYPFLRVDKTTSVFRTPYDPTVFEARKAVIERTRPYLEEKFKYYLRGDFRSEIPEARR